MRGLAEAARVQILADDKSLDIVITRIHGAMHDWVMRERFKDRAPRRRAALTWAQSLTAWLEDGIVILGGIPESAKHGWVKEGPALLDGYALLMRALAIAGPDNRTRRQLAAALRQAGIEDAFPDGAFKAEPWPEAPQDPLEFQLWWAERHPTRRPASEIKHLLGRLLGSLGALRVLTPSLKQYASKIPARERKDIDRPSLIRELSDCFLKLHQKNYTVISPNPASRSSRRSLEPVGPALDWTRELFRLFADRSEAMADASSANKFPEFRELAKWSKKSHALAELIKKRPTRRRRGV
jgi:hypothetical protein